MNPEYKKMWITALRSGEYSQCNNKLKGDEGYCCLGVIEDVLRPITGHEWKYDGICFQYSIGTEGDASTLTQKTNELIELGSYVGQLPNFGDRTGGFLTLAVLNDSGFTFDQIADTIEYFL